MKINGKTISGPQPEVLVIPKGCEEFVFKALPVLDYSEFEKLCPVPQPPVIVRPGKEEIQDIKDKNYTEKLMEWANRKTSWMVLQSLQATEGLEWETVDMADPSTWDGYMDELKKSFTDHECNLIFDLVITACGLNQKKIDEATKRFLAGQGAGAKRVILPKFRTEDYTIWNTCERLGILPPGCKTNWDDCDVWTQSMLLAYGMIRNYEEAENG